MTFGRWGKYAAYFAIGLAEARADRGELFARMLFFGVILGVFSALWRAVAEAGMPVTDSPATLVWYLGITEWIVFSVPAVHIDVAEDVRRGDVAYSLSRPVSYLAAAYASGAGKLCVRMPFLGAAGFVYAWFFAGGLPERAAGLLWAMPLGVAAGLGLLAIYVVLGVLAFWLGDVTPAQWVTNKLLFVLGGLMLPLDMYPEALARAAWFTPFPWLLYGPASSLLQGRTGRFAEVALGLAFWLFVTLAVAGLLFRRARRTLVFSGG